MLAFSGGWTGAQPATAAPAAGATTRAATAGLVTNPIKHVVVILQENHSFDNVLGKFCAEVADGQIVRPGTDGTCDGATTGETSSGQLIPLAPATDYVPSADHSVTIQQVDINNGAMNGFNHDANCTRALANCYNQYDPLSGPCTAGSCIPNVATLARDYTVSDHTFELSATPSWSGHLIWATANMDGFAGDIPQNPTTGQPQPVGFGPGWGCDAGTVTPWGSQGVMVPSCVPNSQGWLGPNWAGYTGTKAPYVPTIFDELQAKGRSWRIYGGAGSAGSGVHFNGGGWAFAICPTFAECLYSSQRRNLVPANNVMTDAAGNNLPSFSIVTPIVANSQHNNDDMSTGDDWIGQVVSAIQSSPSWSSTAIFITWDDCGCFYDHVSPLKFDHHTTTKIPWGVRVPMIIVSPYAKAGYTDTGPTTYAGVLGFVEHLFGLPALDPMSDGFDYNYSSSFCYNPQVSGCHQAGLTPVRMVSQKPTPMSRAQKVLSLESGSDDT
jgi:phospholipase C